MRSGESRTKFKPLSSKMSVVGKLYVKSHTKKGGKQQTRVPIGNQVQLKDGADPPGLQ